jgi:hypothetical protein
VLRRGRGGEKEIEQSCCRGEGDKAPEIRKQRRKGIGFPQGLMRKNRKLRGPDCKTKSPVDLKLK